MSVADAIRTCGRPGRPRQVAGFTLIELMIVLGIISILASVALPRYTKFVFRARRSEAYLGLKGIHTAQQTFYAETGRYGATFAEIGFELDGGDSVDANIIDGHAYRFEMGAFEHLGAPKGNFWATATADLISEDPVMDILLIENHAIVEE